MTLPAACPVTSVTTWELASKVRVTRTVTPLYLTGKFPAARMSFGLLEGQHLLGVVVLGVPMHPAVLTKPFPTLGAREAAEVSRLVLLDEVPANAESARCCA